MSKEISKGKRLQVYNKTGGRCSYCGIKLYMDVPINYSDYFGIDHVNSYPRNNNINNLTPCCRSCNSSKGRKSLNDFKILRSLKQNNLNFSVEQYEYLKDNYSLDLLKGKELCVFYYEREEL